MIRLISSCKKCINQSTTPSPASPNIVLLDFDGYTVSGTGWNADEDIVCLSSGLSGAEQLEVLESVQEDYDIFDIVITTDENLYNSVPSSQRIRCIITETWEWFGQVGGTSFHGSFRRDNDNPCFVFSSLLGTVKKIKEAVSHELGHTLGLYHQAVYNENCVLTSEYNMGGDGEAPIMGIGYYQPDVKWWIGPTSHGCNDIQDDVAVLTSVLGLK